MVSRKRIKTATEAVQLNQVKIVARGHEFRRIVEARVIHPLIHHADRTLKTRHVRDRIFREHCQAEALEQLGDSMVDLGIEVIRPARQHDAMRARILHPFERLFTLVADVLLEGHIFSPSSLDRRFDVLLARQLALCILHELPDASRPAPRRGASSDGLSDHTERRGSRTQHPFR